MQDKGMKAWDERIQAIENNLAKTTDLAEKNSNRLHTRKIRPDGVDDESLDSAILTVRVR